MRIVFYSPTNLGVLGGAERWLVEVSNRLRARGHNVEIVCLGNDQITEFVTTLDKRIDYLELSCIRLLRGYPIPLPPNIRRLLEIFNAADVVYFFVCSPNEMLFLSLQNMLKRPMAGGFHLSPVPRTVSAKLYFPFLRFSLKIFSGFHVLNKYVRETMAMWGCQNVYLVPNGVDTASFGLCNPPHNSAFTILFTGRHSRDKGVDILVEVIKRFASHRESLHDFRFVVTGGGPLSYLIKSLSERYDFVEYSKIVPWNLLPGIYRKAHLFVAPSRIEGFPLRILEAEACGLPVIGSNIPGIRDIVGDFGSGCLLNVGDSNGFVKAIEKYYEMWKVSPEEYHSMNRNIRSNIVKNYDWNIIMPRLESMLENVAYHSAC